MTLCKYSNIFGNPGKGLHKYRIFNIAIVDVVLSVLLAILIYYILNFFELRITFLCVLLFVLIFKRDYWCTPGTILVKILWAIVACCLFSVFWSYIKSAFTMVSNPYPYPYPIQKNNEK